MASSSTATVLPAPPFGLTTVTWRRPPKLRRTISTSCLYSCSRLPGESLTRPSAVLLRIARAPIEAVGSAGLARRRRANSSAVGVPSETQGRSWNGSTGGWPGTCWGGGGGGALRAHGGRRGRRVRLRAHGRRVRARGRRRRRRLLRHRGWGWHRGGALLARAVDRAV